MMGRPFLRATGGLMEAGGQFDEEKGPAEEGTVEGEFREV